MLARLLKENRLVSGVALASAALALAVAGCFGRLALWDLRHLGTGGPKHALSMGGCEALRDPEVACVACHSGARTKEKAGMPDRDLCLSCHGGLPDAALFELGADYFDKDGRPKWEAIAVLSADVRFSHVAHERSECDECHGNIERADFSLMDLATHYENCRRCHRHDDVTGNCLRCHTTFKASRRPHSHDARWLDDHGWAIRDAAGIGATERACGACHNTSFCVECHHEKQPRDHNVFWARAGHGPAADIDRKRCYVCHGQDECVSCHTDGTGPAILCTRTPATDSAGCLESAGCHQTVLQPSLRPVATHRILTENCRLCHKF